MTCDRCGDDADETCCTGCGSPDHDTCDLDEEGLGAVCGRCWAVLSHVEHVIDCASMCRCREDYPDVVDGSGN